MSIKKQAVLGVKWTSVSTITLAFSALLKISILARFLKPSDFGLMALITFILGFMDLFMDMGITSAILHKQGIKKKEYASLYWLNIGFSLLLFTLIFLISPLLASFYQEPQLVKLVRLSGIIIIFSAIGRQHKTIFQKELRFKTIAIVDITSILISLISAVILAIYGLGVYALVFSAIIQYCINNIVYFMLGIKRNPILFHYDYVETKRFLKIGVYQVGGHMINYFNRDLDVLIIGKFFGTDILGGYSLAKQLVRRPVSIIDPIINKVGISILPRHQSNNVLLLKYFNMLVKNLSIINAFVYGAIAIAAPIIVSILYGEQYQNIVSLVQLFSIVVYFRSISGLIGILSITKGRTDLEFYWNFMISIIMPLVMFIGINQSEETIVFLIAITQMLLIFPIWYMFYSKQINMPFNLFVKNVFIPFIISGGLFFTYNFLDIKDVWFQIFSCALLLVILVLYTIHSDREVLNFIKKNKYVKPFIKN